MNPNTPIKYGASYKSTTTLAANTPEAVFSAAANINGAIVWMANAYNLVSAGAGQKIAFIAKNTAPASVIDGDILSVKDQNPQSSGYGAGCSINICIFIPAGKALYFISDALESSALRTALYTLL